MVKIEFFFASSLSYPAILKEKCMNSNTKLFLLRISSVMMLLVALPMLLLCLDLIDNAALDYTYAGAGCFVTGLVYIFSIVTATAGLMFAGKPHWYHWCRTLGYIQLVTGFLLVCPLHSYATITLPPLYLTTVLYLVGLGSHEKWKFKQQKKKRRYAKDEKE